MPSLIKTGIKYGALFGAAKVVTDNIAKASNNHTSHGEYSTGPLQSNYAHESWCNGNCGDRCRSRGQQPQQQQQQQQYQQPREQQFQPLYQEPQHSQIGWGHNGYIHQAGCKGDCGLRCCDGVAAGQIETNGPPAYQTY